jgi:hypothetical protein
LHRFISNYYSPSDKWYYTYAAPGATIMLSWIVTGSNGQRLANTPVTLQTQFAPGANNGKGDTDVTFSAPSMVNDKISATTNSVGEVSFTFTNTNGSANAAPAGWNSYAVSSASGVAPKTTVADVAAETLGAAAVTRELVWCCKSVARSSPLTPRIPTLPKPPIWLT